MTHSPEPWYVACEGFLYDANNNTILDDCGWHKDHGYSDYERAVECVNACEGIPSHVLKAIADGKVQIALAGSPHVLEGEERA